MADTITEQGCPNRAGKGRNGEKYLQGAGIASKQDGTDKALPRGFI